VKGIDMAIDFDEVKKRAIAKAEVIRKEQAMERAKTFSIKDFLDSVKSFEKTLKHVSDTIDSNDLSPELIQRTINKINKVRISMDQLKVKLDEKQTDDRMR